MEMLWCQISPHCLVNQSSFTIHMHPSNLLHKSGENFHCGDITDMHTVIVTSYFLHHG